MPVWSGWLHVTSSQDDHWCTLFGLFGCCLVSNPVICLSDVTMLTDLSIYIREYNVIIADQILKAKLKFENKKNAWESTVCLCVPA